MCKYRKGDRVFFDALNTGIVRDVYPNSSPPQYLVKGLTRNEEKLFTSHIPIPEILSQSTVNISTQNIDIRLSNTIGGLTVSSKKSRFFKVGMNCSYPIQVCPGFGYTFSTYLLLHLHS